MLVIMNFILEAAIGIEPMNKGFAVHTRHFAPNCTLAQTQVNKILIKSPRYTMQDDASRVSPQISPQWLPIKTQIKGNK
jgi:hypothetical protein